MTNAQERLVGLSLDGQDCPFPSHAHVDAGSAKCMARLGWVVAPPIELSISEEYDLRLVHVMLWLSWLISARRVRAFMVEPVCTTFSIMRRPALRSKFVPVRFQRLEFADSYWQPAGALSSSVHGFGSSFCGPWTFGKPILLIDQTPPKLDRG